MRPAKLLWLIIRVLLFLAAIYYLITRIDFSILPKMFSQTQWPYIILTFIAVLLTQVVRAVRFGYILKTLKISSRFKKLFWVQSIANFWSRLTPGKLGDLGKVAFFPKKGVTLPYAVLEKLLVVCALFLLASPIVFIFERTVAIIIVFLIIIAAIVGLFLLTQEKWFNKVKALIKKVIKKELPPKPSLSLVITVFLWGIIDWLLSAVAFYAIALALGFTFPIFMFIGAVCASIAVGSIVGVPGGYGAREAALAFFLTQLFFIPSADAVLIALYAIIIITVSEFILFAIGHFFVKTDTRGAA